MITIERLLTIFGNLLMGQLNLVLRIGLKNLLTVMSIVFLVMQIRSNPKIAL